MTMKRLALYNFGMFKVAASDPANQGFHDRNDPNFAGRRTGRRLRRPVGP